MDCLTAQGLISDAVDREPVDAALLAEAKQHCLSCPSCSLFVRSLLIAKNVPAPTPPADLVDRVMVTIRARDEAARAATTAAVTEPNAGEVAHDGSDPAMLPTPTDGPQPVADTPARGLRAAFVAWAGSLSLQQRTAWASVSVAAVVLLGFGTIAGIRAVTFNPIQTDVATTRSAAPLEMGASLATGSAADGSAVQVEPAVQAGSYATVQGVVYLLRGPSSIATDSLQPVGTVLSALGSGGAPLAHPAYLTPDAARAYVYDNAGRRLLEFDRVVRSFGGGTYQLMSAELSDFGQWPTLPANITPPVAMDGSPTFEPVPSVSTNAEIYRQVALGTEVGIGVAPGTDSSDPAAGNPNWTWWTRIP